MNSEINDVVLEEYEAQWPDASPKEKAQILSALIMYVKRKYDVQNFRKNIDAKTKELEHLVEKGIPIGVEFIPLELKEFLPVSRAIGYARKQIKELGNTYGTGLKRKPKGAELKDARSFKPVAVRNSPDSDEEDDSDSGSGDEFLAGDLEYDSSEMD
jgi:hypothetical protein